MEAGMNRKAIWLLIGSFLLLIGVTLLRLIVGARTGTGALILEGMHSLIDILLSAFILLAVVLVRSKFSRRFPYGLYRLEDLAAILLAVFILFSIGTDFGSLSKVPKEVQMIVPEVQAATIPLLVGVVLTKREAAVLLRSPSLKADAVHMVVDVIESSSVAVGLTLYYFLRYVTIYYVTFAIAILGLVMAAYEACHESVKAILDLPKEKELIEKVKEIIKRTSPEVEVIEVKGRWAGPVIYLEALIRLHPLKTIEDAGRISERISREIRREIEGIEDVIVRIEPSVRQEMTVAIPLEEPRKNSPLSQHFGRAKYFLIAKVRKSEVVEEKLIENPVLEESGKGPMKEFLKGAKLAEFMVRQEGVTDLITTNIGELAFSLFLRHRILVWKGDPSLNALQNLEKFCSNELERMAEPTREVSWKRKNI